MVPKEYFLIQYYLREEYRSRHTAVVGLIHDFDHVYHSTDDNWEAAVRILAHNLNVDRSDVHVCDFQVLGYGVKFVNT